MQNKIYLLLIDSFISSNSRNMKLLFSIIINGLILYAITYLLGPNPEKSIEAGIILGCNDCSYTSLEALKTYIIGGIIL